jgi:predicted unusual protein kinase regulating ubiquinone biosynthesis (AarF/ABC1/UbiB family)
MKKEQAKIPTGKVKRASKVIATGAKVGSNYVKYFAKKAIGNEHAKEQLDEANADDIYNTLSEMKGGALKAAQIMSMDRNFLPQAFQDKFAQAQYKVPPLSYPLVVKTFKQYFSKTPTEIFSTFNKTASNAASIGQVHKATIGNINYAVKVQYPGVAESISSDLKLVKPIAVRMLNLKDRDVDKYFKEVEQKLIEETDYINELNQSIEISEACSHIPNLIFPQYFKKYSSEKILTMTWVKGDPLSVFLKTNPSQEIRNKVGQAIWDFYTYQMNELKAVHADPHPGNFLVQPNGIVAPIDFGCVKRIPEDFFKSYSKFLDGTIFNDDERFKKVLFELEFLLPEDTEEETETFFKLFKEMIPLFSLPFRSGEFDFETSGFMDQINAISTRLSTDKKLRKLNTARGSKHLLYVNRTNFGLFAIIDDLKAKITNNFNQKEL